jgi:hypothetical protein
MDLEAEVRRLIDEREVSKVILRYAQGLDSRRFEQVWECFAPDAVVEGSRFSGPLPEYLPPLLAGVEGFGVTMHFMGNQLREVHGDTATTETYCIAHHFVDPKGQQEAIIMGVRYYDDLVRTDDGRWVIKHRKAVADWIRYGEGYGPS